MNTEEQARVLGGALSDLVIEFEDMLPYVPDYFREKWGYDDALAEARAVLNVLDVVEENA